MMRRVDRGDGVELAFVHHAGRGPLVLFLPGYMSDMSGTKALFLEGHLRARGRAFLRLDYSGCGASGGDFADGGIRRWAADVAAVVTAVGGGPVVPVGSSMGGWVMLRLPGMLDVRAMVGIAAAPDFTDWGLVLDEADRVELSARGYVSRPSAYGDAPYRYHRALLEDADGARALDGLVAFEGPVRLLHGQADADVPWDVSLRLMAALGSADVQLILVKDGDHRLSRPGDLALLGGTLDAVLEAL
ncbi:alpha/beta fold hydrolase [Sandaracinobacteroides saxicola]|uniref:Palmitoyl-protein thioesterase ABHD10, mitochondrial n=1 Tax=Sandaracinobacteroides saxicola TaxID=2759707 RepID=A0A7G5IJ88_9SPHN|nr:alpha/beta fold hydrolase [Sandaracinobacteroides saxicola]QMW23430.1 alpha/beta fold hydrolase [Sandaracinobacteroides saxicola]